MQVIYGDDSIFNAITYGEPAPQVYQYVQQEMERAQTLLGQAGSWVLDRAKAFYDSTYNENAFRVARAAVRKVQSLWGSNEIQQLQHIWQVQNAPNKMVRWIMAEPAVRQLYHAGKCAGYDGRYTDAFPTDIGTAHSDYNAVMNGIVVVHEEPVAGVHWYCVNSSSDWDDSEVSLSFADQSNIIDTWEVARAALESGRDPTSAYDIDLG